MTKIHSLPPELIYEIATHLTHEPRTAEAHLSAFARTDRRFYALVNPFLYQHVVENDTFYLLHWTAEHNNLGTLRRALLAGAHPVELWKSPWPYKDTELDHRPIEWHLFEAQDLYIRVRAIKITHAADEE